MPTATKKPTKPKQKYTYADARLRCTKQLPYLTQHVMSLQVVPRPGLGTFAVDKYMRLYYDPKCLEEWTLDECAGVILHEDVHVVLAHVKRLEKITGKTPTNHEVKVWNLSADCVANSMLRDCMDNKKQPSVTMPKEGVYPESFKPPLPLNRTVEEYYFMLLDQIPKGPGADDPYGTIRVTIVEGEPYDGEQPKPGCGTGGSGADGQLKAWELPAPDKCDTPGRSEHEQDMLARKVAHGIEEHRKAVGNVPGCWQRYANQILRPKTDPCRELEAAVKYAVNATYGFGDHTWRKLNRRVPRGSGPLPAHIKPVPRVTVIVDTSGSMDQGDLGRALGVIAQVLKGLPSRDGLHVISGDTCVQTSKKLFRLDQVELAGNGGTDMGGLIEEAAGRTPRPDVILLVTDGCTGYPSAPVGPKVVACITRRNESYPVPSWIKTIALHTDDQE